MLEMNNVEPRRAWRRDKISRRRTDALLEGSACAACGSEQHLSLERGVPFCAECLERSRQANLDELYDDLGTPG